MARKTKPHVLKRIDPVSTGKIYAFILAVFGFFYGIVFGLVLSVGGALVGLAALGFFAGIAVLVAATVIFAVVGFVAGFFSAVLYNFAAGKMGGVRFEFKN